MDLVPASGETWLAHWLSHVSSKRRKGSSALLDTPEKLSAEVLRWCVEHMINYVSIPGDFLDEAKQANQGGAKG
jgi:hypothetical protein